MRCDCCLRSSSAPAPNGSFSLPSAGSSATSAGPLIDLRRSSPKKRGPAIHRRTVASAFSLWQLWREQPHSWKPGSISSPRSMRRAGHPCNASLFSARGNPVASRRPNPELPQMAPRAVLLRRLPPNRNAAKLAAPSKDVREIFQRTTNEEKPGSIRKRYTRENECCSCRMETAGSCPPTPFPAKQNET
jgi:hypothetical protein